MTLTKQDYEITRKLYAIKPETFTTELENIQLLPEGNRTSYKHTVEAAWYTYHDTGEPVAHIGKLTLYINLVSGMKPLNYEQYCETPQLTYLEQPEACTDDKKTPWKTMHRKTSTAKTSVLQNMLINHPTAPEKYEGWYATDVPGPEQPIVPDMKTFIFNKLVRDNIVKLHQAEGTIVDHVTLDDDEHREALIEKLHEETKELYEAEPENVLSELADLQQIIDDLTVLNGHTNEERLQKQAKKKQHAGGFSKKSYIKTISLDNNNPWHQYYADRPNQYPEQT